MSYLEHYQNIPQTGNQDFDQAVAVIISKIQEYEASLANLESQTAIVEENLGDVSESLSDYELEVVNDLISYAKKIPLPKRDHGEQTTLKPTPEDIF